MTATGVARVSDRRRAVEVFRDVYERLLVAYGPQHWWPGETAFEVIVGAILTQSAAWTNVEKALANLKAAGALSPQGLHGLSEGEIARLIRPSGYFNAKARKLMAFVEMLHVQFRGDLERLLTLPRDDLRALLLSTHGIGPETADSIVLYAAGQASFVIDAYTRRMFSRMGVTPSHDSYEGWRALFLDALPADAPMFNEYHALIVAHGKSVCRKTPRCRECVLRDVCETGNQPL
ncbi:MAG TPA: endonuclease [Dehalococcoidia bacterium]|nr:endonuclease [Dehalococcoidia bacterium]